MILISNGGKDITTQPQTKATLFTITPESLSFTVLRCDFSLMHN